MSTEPDRNDGSDPAAPESPAEQVPAERFAVRPVVRAPKTDPAARQISRDETDVGWGDAPAERDDDWYRRERPPHHG